MRVALILHPIGGNIEDNVKSIHKIIRDINLNEKDVVPIAPYLADIGALDDRVADERNRGLANGRYLMRRMKGAIDEVRVYGHKLSSGMKKEIIIAYDMHIPIGVFDERIVMDVSKFISKTISGGELIVTERSRQIDELGYDEAHDDEHVNEEIAKAAACYILPQHIRNLVLASGKRLIDVLWPWEEEYWKPKANNHLGRIKELYKGGALAAAEIERRQRAIHRGENPTATEEGK